MPKTYKSMAIHLVQKVLAKLLPSSVEPSQGGDGPGLSRLACLVQVLVLALVLVLVPAVAVQAWTAWLV